MKNYYKFAYGMKTRYNGSIIKSALFDSRTTYYECLYKRWHDSNAGYSYYELAIDYDVNKTSYTGIVWSEGIDSEEFVYEDSMKDEINIISFIEEDLIVGAL